MFEPQFLRRPSSPQPWRLGVLRGPDGRPPIGLMVYLHPFAEEMNKSRRMAALQATALAEAGWAVLAIDLLGCGDSQGDFADATWEDWVADGVFACEWLRQRFDTNLPLWLWGLRAGCLLAAEAASRRDDVQGLLLWQPSASGRQVLNQFLRLKSAAALLDGSRGTGTEALRQQLLGGDLVEVAGYGIAPGLATGLDKAELRAPSRIHSAIWLELSMAGQAALSPAALATTARWQAAGLTIDARAVSGPSFWQTSEIEDAPDLIVATLAALGAASRQTSSSDTECHALG